VFVTVVEFSPSILLSRCWVHGEAAREVLQWLISAFHNTEIHGAG